MKEEINMNVKWINEDKDIIGTITFQEKTLYFFEKNRPLLKLERAELEFINQEGLMINGFENLIRKTKYMIINVIILR